mmetsp:Transcript_946/g.2196  ORF Transcript_946/g.2196 Transcript_946/m.2196 type:complete len:242 (-) Transcript_946:783-1508(-)
MSEMMDLPFCRSTLARLPKDCFNMRSSSSPRSRDHILDGSRVTDTDTSLVATTSTEISNSSNTRKTLDRKPYCPSMRLLTMSTRVTPDLSTMLESNEDDMSLSLQMMDPGADGLYELRTRTLRSCLHSKSGIMDCGWRTVAPKYASSVASATVSKGMGFASGQTRGSVVSTPSTSFHTMTSSMPRAAPRKVLVRSEPPRPRVVIAPVLMPRPRKPVTTGRTGWPCSSKRPRFLFTWEELSS